MCYNEVAINYNDMLTPHRLNNDLTHAHTTSFIAQR